MGKTPNRIWKMNRREETCRVRVNFGPLSNVSPQLLPNNFAFIVGERKIRCNKIIAGVVSPYVCAIHKENVDVSEFNVDYEGSSSDMELILSIQKSGSIDVPLEKIDDLISLCIELGNMDILKQLHNFARSRRKGETNNTHKVDNIQNNKTKLMIEVGIRGLDDGTILLVVPRYYTVDELKEKIEAIKGINTERQILTFNNKILTSKSDDGTIPTLGDYGIDNGDYVYLSIKSNNINQSYQDDYVIRIVVKQMGNGVSTEFKVKINTKVEELKEIIYKELQIQPSYQRLIYSGINLSNGKTLRDYSLKDNSLIKLIRQF